MWPLIGININKIVNSFKNKFNLINVKESSQSNYFQYLSFIPDKPYHTFGICVFGRKGLLLKGIYPKIYLGMKWFLPGCAAFVTNHFLRQT